jgi:tryptophan halogenase
MTPKRLLIVGGGSAGWMAAAYLDAALNRGGRRVVDVTLVESPDVPRIGVGEATVPSINHILAVIGLEEREFLRRVDGSLKQAIRYDNWLLNRGETYYHPFNRYRESPVDRTTRRWLKSDRSIPFAATVSAQPALCQANLAPAMLAAWDFGPPLSYAYHMNALKFADYLCEVATARGVTHYLDHVTEVEMHENGDIRAINTRDGLRLEADLYIDCTGFAALLIEKKLGVGWVDCSQWLLNNRAITMAVPCDTYYPGYIRPYTTATALSSGWVWQIPLQDKRSLGYVHSSAYIDEDAARDELRAFEGAHAAELDTRTIRFKVGHRQKAWVRNCIAIGLAANFIEPLESTGLYLSDLASVMLTEHFPQGGDMDALMLRFNRIMANRFYEILDFINLHFCLSRRTDTEYWREVRKPHRINDRLAAKLEYWRKKPPSPSDFEDMRIPDEPDTSLPSGGLPGDHRPPVDTGVLFGLDSHEHILYGMDFLRDECDAWFGKDRPPGQVAPQVASRLAVAPQKLPPHHVWLERALGISIPGGRGDD